MVVRFMCTALEEIRDMLKHAEMRAHQKQAILFLLEETQSLANRMEDALREQRKLRDLSVAVKIMRKKRNILERKLKKLEKKVGVPKTAVKETPKYTWKRCNNISDFDSEE